MSEATTNPTSYETEAEKIAERSGSCISGVVLLPGFKKHFVFTIRAFEPLSMGQASTMEEKEQAIRDVFNSAGESCVEVYRIHNQKGKAS